ncbi:hypothetical protein G6L37_06895 [Agrobacterium rubi]|nr:hypothetical protein [Agrobacterium rubi]NTF25092.1 hypothetical protein [Agrobacterium rubi]
MTLIHKEVSPLGDWIVYMNGVALYKKWPTGRSVLFDKFGPPISNKDRDAMPHGGTPLIAAQTSSVEPSQAQEPDALARMIVRLLSGRSSDASFIERTSRLFVLASDVLNWKDFANFAVFTLPDLRAHFRLDTLLDCHDPSLYPTMPVEIRSPIWTYLKSIPDFQPTMGHEQPQQVLDWHKASEDALIEVLGSLCEDDEQVVLREPLRVADSIHPDGGANWITYLLDDAASRTEREMSDNRSAVSTETGDEITPAAMENSDMNPFKHGDKDTLARMVAGLLADGTSDENLVARATHLFIVVNDALQWKERAQLAKFDLNQLRDHFNLKIVIDLLNPVINPGVPAEIIAPVMEYLKTLPQYRPEMGHKQSQTTFDEHGMAEMQLTKLLGSLYGTYQHLRTDVIDNPCLDILEGVDLNMPVLPTEGRAIALDHLAKYGKLPSPERHAAPLVREANEEIPDDIIEIATQLEHLGRGPNWIDIARAIFDERKRWQAEIERYRKAADYIAPYLRWTVSDESPGHPSTMPSAVEAFHASFDIDTPQKRMARVRASTKLPHKEG